MGSPYSQLASRTVKEAIGAQHKVQRQAKPNSVLRTHALSDRVQLENQDHGDEGVVIGTWPYTTVEAG